MADQPGREAQRQQGRIAQGVQDKQQLAHVARLVLEHHQAEQAEVEQPQNQTVEADQAPALGERRQALFPAGEQYDVSVPLLRATEAGQNYQALIYFDDGTKTFNLKTETIVLNPDGSVAGATFNVK